MRQKCVPVLVGPGFGRLVWLMCVSILRADVVAFFRAAFNWLDTFRNYYSTNTLMTCTISANLLSIATLVSETPQFLVDFLVSRIICRTWNSGQKEGLVCRLIYEEKRLYIHGVGASNRGETGGTQYIWNRVVVQPNLGRHYLTDYCCHPCLNLNELQFRLPGHTNFRICRTLLPASFSRIPAEDVHDARHLEKVLHRSRPLGQALPTKYIETTKAYLTIPLTIPINSSLR